MEDFLTAEDYELWTIVNQGPLTPTKQNAQNETVPKDPYEFVAADFKMMEKNAKAKKFLSVDLIWDALQTAHEGTNQVKRSKIELLMRNYELSSMKESERIQDMMIRFIKITNELKSLGKEAKELDKISLDELVGNLKTHEMRKIELRKEEPKRDKALVLKASE
ncbi:uncharacterized protein [Nicotiana tomentosiformis]|uniref:uncharacterized protein n=1 Tax=Nicotiana tomentosiformis TaxID=4098 RepID=UPI00388CA291